MKKTVSRILALIVALSMLVAPAAFAAERNAATLAFGNFVVTIGEEVIEIPVGFTLGGGVDLENARGYVSANVATEEQVALGALAALENGELKAYINGMSSGIVIPMEQLLTLLEEEMGASLEDLMTELTSELESAITPEMQQAITSLLDSAMALENIGEVDPEAILKALNITLTEGETATVTLFDVEEEGTEIAFSMAPATMKALIDNLGDAIPELGAYYDNYFAMMDSLLAESGEEMTTAQALELVTMGIEGSLYPTASGLYAELAITASVEGETIVLPIEIVTLTDDLGTYSQVIVDVPVDGEGLYFVIYADEFADETGAYQNLIYSIDVYDLDTYESEMMIAMQLYTTDDESGTTVGLDVEVTEDESSFNAGAYHTCYNVTETEDATSYDGLLYAYMIEDEMVMDFAMDTNLTLTSVPEGELLSFTSSINPFEADEEAMEAFANDAMNVLMQGAGVLMQDPTIAGLLGGAMN